ncbi:MAG: 50S ribosomal protein L35ae [Candidatus Ranarchaeia archaeon]
MPSSRTQTKTKNNKKVSASDKTTKKKQKTIASKTESSKKTVTKKTVKKSSIKSETRAKAAAKKAAKKAEVKPKKKAEVKPKKKAEVKPKKKTRKRAGKATKKEIVQPILEKPEPQVVVKHYGIVLGIRKKNKRQVFIGFPEYDGTKADQLIGRSVIWRQGPKQKSIRGKILHKHGRKGTLIASFSHGLPGQAIGTQVILV